MANVIIYKEMLGKAFSDVLIKKGNARIEDESDELIFSGCYDGDTSYSARFHHYQSCCESVAIESVDGDLEDLKDRPITMAESVSNKTTESPTGEYINESMTWTFLKIGTSKGVVTFRWFGSSSGYYSEEIDYDFTSTIVRRGSDND